MNVYSGGSEAKRRKVRKGTHSCWECKRRKVKCIFTSPVDSICMTCRRRGSKCISQEIADEIDIAKHDLGIIVLEEPSLDQRVHKYIGNATELENNSALGSLLAPDLSESQTSTLSRHGNHPKPISNGTHDKSTEQQPPSLLISAQQPSTPPSSHVPLSTSNKHHDIVQALLNVFPSQRDVEIILGRATGVAMLCYQSNLKSRSSMKNIVLQEQVEFANLMQPETHPVLLARQMLLFSAALQYLSRREVIPGLSEHHHVIMNRLAETSIKMVTTNDILLSSLESLETIILEGYFHIDNGNIRRAWIAMRRAVMAAQLLGLHRPDQYRFKIISAKNDLDPQNMWLCIISMERMLSLLLGLPTSTATIDHTLYIPATLSEEDKALPTLLIGVTAKMLRRNEIREPQQALSLTRELDKELVAISEQLPSAFWRPLKFTGMEIDSNDAFWETRRTWDHMCYYTLVNQLHLPYLLCPSIGPQNIYSKLACVNASREILTREIAFRTFNPITACCRMGDFLALIAGMTLMLAHIVSHCNKEIDNLLIHQRLTDRATTEQALECMTAMSELQDDVLTAKCAALLKHLLVIEANAAHGQQNRAHHLDMMGNKCEDDFNALIIKVPYFGIIRIAQDGITSFARLDVAQDQRLQEGVTIGGIGYVHVDSPESSNESFGKGISEALPCSATARTCSALSGSETVTAPPHLATRNFPAQQDQRLPDAAAEIDEWAFQGFDAAFFDVLMHGASDQQLPSSNAENWGFGGPT